MDLLPAVVVIALALGFAVVNGFHDASNAVATSVSTRALTPQVAVTLAAVANLIGAFFGAKVAQTIGSDIVQVPVGAIGLQIVAAGLVGAIAWDLLTWWFGMPASSTHALVAGLAGATVLAGIVVTTGAGEGAAVRWGDVLSRVILPMVVSPVLGLIAGYAAMVALMWVLRRVDPARTVTTFRYAQSTSATAMAFGHGLQDAGKAAGVVALVWVAAGRQSSAEVPGWALAGAAVAMGLGTYAGGWRIVRTLGRRITDLEPAQGFVAEAAAATILYASGAVAGAPISTTFTIAPAILGVGATRRVRSVRWDVVRRIAVTWALTLPAAAVLGALAFLLIHVTLR